MEDFQTPSEKSAVPRESLTGTVVGRFAIHERLGKGGMGEVYSAEDTKLRRRVALKRLAPDLRADPVYRLRFLHEAKRASRFSDAHVAALYDILEEQGEIFLVMEYVAGENLRERFARTISIGEFLEIAIQCAEGLVAAHERDIVHCDVKPENIMLTNNGSVKILDFGVAKHLPRSDQSSTVDRSLSGTPAYMSPEVLLEKIPDGRADLFSLGVVFYEMLTGHHPFLSNSFVETIDRIRRETPAPIHSFNPDVPSSLESLINKAMAKKPEQRYSSARELLNDLRTVQAGITPSRLRMEMRAVAQRRWLPWAIAGALALTLIFVGVWKYHNVRHAPVMAERGWVLISDFETHGEEPLPDAAVREGLTIALQQSRYVNVFPRTRAYDVLNRMKKANLSRIDENLGREICRRENLQVLLSGSVEHIGQMFQITVRAVDPLSGGLLFAEQERFRRQEDFFEKADEVAKRVRKDLGESLAGIAATSRPLAKVTTASLEALQLYSQAKNAMDQGGTEGVLGQLQGALHFDPDFAMAHLQLAQYYGSVVGKNERAVTEATRAFELRQGVTDRERLRIEAAYFSIQERYDDVVQSRMLLVNLYPDDAEAHLDLAGAYYDIARVDQTITELRKVLKLDPLSPIAYSQLVGYLARNNQNDEAIAAYDHARHHGVETPELHRGLGLAYLGQGKVDQARQQFRIVAASGDLFQDLGEFYLAATDVYEGKFSRAREHLESLIRRSQAEHSKGLRPVSRYLLGRMDLVLQQPQLARHEAEEIMATPPEDLQIIDLRSAGILCARAGAIESAKGVLRSLDNEARRSPTAWNKSAALITRGEVALAQHDPKQASEAFLSAEAAYPQAPASIGLAMAYQDIDTKLATDQWQKVLQIRGEILREEFPADLALAHLQLARLLGRSGNTKASIAQYDEFLLLWHDADNLPDLRDARQEKLLATEKSQAFVPAMKY